MSALAIKSQNFYISQLVFGKNLIRLFICVFFFYFHHAYLLVSLSPPVPEGPPNNLTGSATSTTSVALSWLPVTKELRKGNIRGFQVKIDDDNGMTLNVTTVQDSSLSASFGELSVYSNYSLQARAFTRKGFGPWSASVKVSTGAPGKMRSDMNITIIFEIVIRWRGVLIVSELDFGSNVQTGHCTIVLYSRSKGLHTHGVSFSLPVILMALGNC